MLGSCGCCVWVINPANMQMLHIAMLGWASSNRSMKTKDSRVRTYRDVFALVADLGYSSESVSGLRRQAEDIDFTAMLEARRQAAGLTQAEVAKRMGTQAPAIARLESSLASGKHSPSLNTLRKYAAALGKRIELHLV